MGCEDQRARSHGSGDQRARSHGLRGPTREIAWAAGNNAQDCMGCGGQRERSHELNARDRMASGVQHAGSHGLRGPTRKIAWAKRARSHGSGVQRARSHGIREPRCTKPVMPDGFSTTGKNCEILCVGSRSPRDLAKPTKRRGQHFWNTYKKKKKKRADVCRRPDDRTRALTLTTAINKRPRGPAGFQAIPRRRWRGRRRRFQPIRRVPVQWTPPPHRQPSPTPRSPFEPRLASLGIGLSSLSRAWRVWTLEYSYFVVKKKKIFVSVSA